MRNKKLFITVGAVFLLFTVLLSLWLMNYFSPKLPEFIAREVQVGELKGVRHKPRHEVAEQSALTLSSTENTIDHKEIHGHVDSVDPSPASATTVTNPELAPLEKPWIQVGTFTDPHNLQNRLDALKKEGFQTMTEETTINGKIAHRIFVGPFRTTAELEQQHKALEALGYQGFATQRTTQ